MEKQTAVFRDLGQMDYKAAWDYQESLLQKNVKIKSEARSGEPEILSQAAGIGSLEFTHITEMEEGTHETENLTTNHQPPTTNYLLFVEHPPVYTLGKSGKMENVLIGDNEREEKGICFYRTNRGGDITFHGPGQIVGYPILDLEKFYTDIGRYLRELEEVIILALAEYGIEAGRSPGETGVWIDPLVTGKERKICAMGVRCSRWVTMHGFAFNVNTDLSYFNHIVPCGIQNKKVTSLKEELGREVPLEDVKERLKKNFEKVFHVHLEE
jgi:lipoyl(octanoyl) transferase